MKRHLPDDPHQQVRQLVTHAVLQASKALGLTDPRDATLVEAFRHDPLTKRLITVAQYLRDTGENIIPTQVEGVDPRD